MSSRLNRFLEVTPRPYDLARAGAWHILTGRCFIDTADQATARVRVVLPLRVPYGIITAALAAGAAYPARWKNGFAGMRPELASHRGMLNGQAFAFVTKALPAVSCQGDMAVAPPCRRWIRPV